MKQINFLLFKITAILILFYSINGFSQNSLVTICGEDFHGVGHAHQDCTEDIVITSTDREGTEGTILAGVIYSEGKISIIPGVSRVKLVYIIGVEPNTHRTKVGGNGGNTGGAGRPANLNEMYTLKVTVSPNPTKSVISFSSTTHKINKYSIYNFYGIMVQQEAIEPSVTYTYNIQHLKKGIYLLKLQLENGEQITKTIIKD